MSPCGSTLGDGAGTAYGAVSRVFTLRGGVTCGGSDLLKMSASFWSYAACLSPDVMSGIVGVGLRRVWVRSAAACIAKSLEDILGKVSVSRKQSVVSETLSFAVLGI